jgi:Replication-relaxation
MAGKITKNDVKLLSSIAEYKFLTVEQLAALSQRSKQVIRRRLRFFENEYLIVKKEHGFGKGPGRLEHIIILSESGMELLRDKDILSSHAIYFTDKTKAPLFIDHDLLVNWFFIHLLQIGRDNPRFITHHLTISAHNLKEGNAEKPFLQERFSTDQDHEKINIMIPDGVFTIHDKESDKSLLFFLEVDMGTETLAKIDRTPGDVRQKIINYQALFQSNHYKRYEKIFNAEFNGFRLLFLTHLPTTMKAICGLIQEMPGSEFIWVTDQERMFSNGISAEIWARSGWYDKPPESILSQKFAFDSTVVDKIK